MIDVDAAAHLEGRLRLVVHGRPVDDDLPGSGVGPGAHLAAAVGRRWQFGNLQALADDVGAFMDKDAVARLHPLQCFVNGQYWRLLRAGICIVAVGGHVDVRGRCCQGRCGQQPERK